MPDYLKSLPDPSKKVAAKVLVNEGYSTREVEEILGVSDTSVLRYSHQETPDELKHFEAELTEVFRRKEHIIAAKALKRIEAKIDYAQIEEALTVYREMRRVGASGLNQINVGGDLKVEFVK